VPRNQIIPAAEFGMALADVQQNLIAATAHLIAWRDLVREDPEIELTDDTKLRARDLGQDYMHGMVQQLKDTVRRIQGNRSGLVPMTWEDMSLNHIRILEFILENLKGESTDDILEDE
jgi:hypothetical protein